ncbi:GntR family transcriptional regulator, partial [Xanthomonas oryzae pv. oryzae]
MAKPRTNARTDDDPRVEALALDVSAPTPLYLQLATKLTDAIRG